MSIPKGDNELPHVTLRTAIKGEQTMKQHMLVCFVTGLILAFASVGMTGQNPGTGIQNTSHDLRRDGGGAYIGSGSAASQERICNYCHTPHNKMTPEEAAAAGITRYPIWTQASTTVTLFQTYTRVSDSIGQPGSVSRICLSCHDGSVAGNVYGYVPPVTIWNVKESQATDKVRIRLTYTDNRSFHHPIGLDYNDVEQKDDEINPANSVLRGENKHGMTIGDLLWDGKVECTSCHDVHNSNNEGSKFTWVADYRSNFCLTCHNK
jgi:predicted CXXCH cytochrome family protein